MLIVPSAIMQQKTQRLSVPCFLSWVFESQALSTSHSSFLSMSALGKAVACLNTIEKLYILPCQVVPIKGCTSLCVSWVHENSRNYSIIFIFYLAIMAFVNGNVEATLMQISNSLLNFRLKFTCLKHVLFNICY